MSQPVPAAHRAVPVQMQPELLPLPVLREGDYHAQHLSANRWPSATAVRNAFWTGDAASANASCGWNLPASPVCAPDALDSILLHRLRTASVQELALLPDCSEGLENRLKSCAVQSISRMELLEKLKTKRYAYARLSRLCCHAMLGITEELLSGHPHPAYVRLLGLRKEAGTLTALFGQSSLPMIAKAADADRNHPLFALDAAAYDLWALGAGIPAGLLFRQGVALV